MNREKVKQKHTLSNTGEHRKGEKKEQTKRMVIENSKKRIYINIPANTILYKVDNKVPNSKMEIIEAPFEKYHQYGYPQDLSKFLRLKKRKRSPKSCEDRLPSV